MLLAGEVLGIRGTRCDHVDRTHVVCYAAAVSGGSRRDPSHRRLEAKAKLGRRRKVDRF